MKTLLLDLDGTMYRGDAVIESAKIFLEACQKHKIPYIFLTNNSMRTREENVSHMEKMGYRGIKPEQFYNSAMASVQYVKAHYTGNKAYYLGKAGLWQALTEEGYRITDQDPDFVFVGLNKEATYAEYSKALTFLLRGAKLIGTNQDRILAKPDGFEIGNGSVVAMFEYASNKKSPDIAKPHTPILDLCLQHYNLQKEDVILIGDNLETDILLGKNAGVETVFVQTGVHMAKDISRLGIEPDHIVTDLRDCLDFSFGSFML